MNSTNFINTLKNTKNESNFAARIDSTTQQHFHACLLANRYCTFTRHIVED